MTGNLLGPTAPAGEADDPRNAAVERARQRLATLRELSGEQRAEVLEAALADLEEALNDAEASPADRV